LTGNVDYHAFSWTQTGGMVDLGTLGGGSSWAPGVSADGNVVVGLAYLNDNTTSHAFYWTQAGDMVDLGTLGGTFSNANGVSADGSVVVGKAELTGNVTSHAFYWTQTGGMADLGTLGGIFSEANGISADGNVVVGGADLVSSARHAFSWTHAGGMVDLGTLGGTNSEAYAASATGKIIVGYSQLTGDAIDHAFRWTQATGMQDLNTLLSNAGVNMTGITLTSATGISSNGEYIAGEGTVSGNNKAFLISYLDGTVDGLVTNSDLQNSTQNLSADLRAVLIQSRSTANELLGATRPTDGTSYTFAGSMFGSAVGYTGGQYYSRGITILGGIAYGAQDYSNIQQGDAPTIAAAMRYTFDDPFQDEANVIHPFVELGGWVTPQADLTLNRTYANGSRNLDWYGFNTSNKLG
jgi:probable HAF family extracellular repeat protein